MFITATGLPRMDLTSNTDPFAVLYCTTRGIKEIIGITECIMDTQTPVWVTSVQLDFVRGTEQDIQVVVYDKEGDHPLAEVARHSLIGQISFNMSTLMSASGTRVSADLRDGRHMGQATVRGEVNSNTLDVFVVEFECKFLKGKDGTFNKTSDPFLQIARLNEDGSWVTVWRNQWIAKNLNPKYPRAPISMVQLCNGDMDRPLRISVYDYESSGKHEFMGNVDLNLRRLIESRGNHFPLLDEKKKDAGVVFAPYAMIEEHGMRGSGAADAAAAAAAIAAAIAAAEEQERARVAEAVRHAIHQAEEQAEHARVQEAARLQSEHERAAEAERCARQMAEEHAERERAAETARIYHAALEARENEARQAREMAEEHARNQAREMAEEHARNLAREEQARSHTASMSIRDNAHAAAGHVVFFAHTGFPLTAEGGDGRLSWDRGGVAEWENWR